MSSRVTPDVGSGRIMATDGGPHPPGLWAQVAADGLTEMGPNFDPANQPALLRFKATLIEALTQPFEECEKAELAALAKDSGRVMGTYDPGSHVSPAVSAVLNAAKGTPWEEHFGDPAVVEAIRQQFEVLFRSVQHMHRSWFADRNLTDPNALAFWKQYHPEPAPEDGV